MRARLILILLSIFMLCGVTAATPIISFVGDSNQVITVGNSHTFEFNSTTEINSADFYLNGIKTTVAGQSKEYTFTDDGEYYNVSVIASDGSDSNMLTWSVTVPREKATVSIETIGDDEEYNNLMDNFTDMDWEGLTQSATTPFTDVMGRMFYVVLFILPFVLMWKQQETMTIPAIVAMFFGTLLIGFVPEQYKTLITFAVILSFAANFYLMSRNRL
ncbi:MAG: hypothetical protein M0R51_09365 [Clostridia bacterium]|nr:hypothetical protein [Clostridia bacterium]